MKSLILKFVRFGLVGAMGAVVDFGITWLCFELLGVNQYVSNSIGFALAATFNYVLNRRWTFKSTNPNIRWEYLKFLSVSVLGLALNNFVIYLFVLISPFVIFNLMGFEINVFWIAKIAATIVVLFWNFFANHYFTFFAKKDK